MRKDDPEEGELTILSARLLLRPMTGEDAEAIQELAGRQNGRGFSLAHDRDEIADARAWIARARVVPGGHAFTAVERGTGSLIGAAGSAPMADHPDRQEVALWVGEPHWGRGYATEAAQALVDHAFRILDVEALWCVCRVTNRRARRVVEKCGFQFRESGMARSVTLRGMVPVERFALTRPTWAGIRSWGGNDRHAPGEFAA